MVKRQKIWKFQLEGEEWYLVFGMNYGSLTLEPPLEDVQCALAPAIHTRLRQIADALQCKSTTTTAHRSRGVDEENIKKKNRTIYIFN